MTDQKKKKVRTPPGPPDWKETTVPQIPDEILKKTQEQLAKQAKPTKKK